MACFKKNLSILTLTAWLSLAFGCGERRAERAFAPAPLRYAELLRLSDTLGCTFVEIADPWHEGRTMQRYCLVPQDADVPEEASGYVIVRTPLRRIASGTALHAALLQELGAEDALAGLFDAEYAVGSALKQLIQTGRLKPAGNSMKPDAELLHALHPDALLLSPFENAGHGSLTTLGVPIIECADYMETSPLGRAEWMRLYGRLAHRGAAADSLFELVAQRYEDCKRKAAATAERPTALCDLPQGGTWFVPGGRSTMGRLFADAGICYLWKDNGDKGSLSLTFESVFDRARNADWWLIKQGWAVPPSRKTLADEFPHAERFKAWREGHVLVCNTLATPYFEEVPFHPERLLQELAAIFHPTLRPEGFSPRYFNYLEK